MLSDALKEQTKTAHQELEKIFVARIRTIASIRDYTDLLGVLYGFYNPLERKIATFIHTAVLPDHETRRKSDAMLRDIHFLQNSSASLLPESNSELPAVGNCLQALGALYVLEGSTLGGAIICKMISSKLDLPDNKGMSYFYSYGDDIHRMWQKFKAALDAVAVNTAEQQEVIDAANQTFNGLKKWMLHAKQL